MNESIKLLLIQSILKMNARDIIPKDLLGQKIHELLWRIIPDRSALIRDESNKKRNQELFNLLWELSPLDAQKIYYRIKKGGDLYVHFDLRLHQSEILIFQNVVLLRSGLLISPPLKENAQIQYSINDKERGIIATQISSQVVLSTLDTWKSVGKWIKPTCSIPSGYVKIDARIKEVYDGANNAIEQAYISKFGSAKVLTGSQFMYGGKAGPGILLPRNSGVDLKLYDAFLKEYNGLERQLCPDIIDFSKHIIYEIKGSSDESIKEGIVQLDSYYRLANTLKIQYGGRDWNQMLASWTPPKTLPFPANPNRIICVFRGPVDGLILYEVYEKKPQANEEKQNPRKSTQQAQEEQLKRSLSHSEPIKNTEVKPFKVDSLIISDPDMSRVGYAHELEKKLNYQQSPKPIGTTYWIIAKPELIKYWADIKEKRHYDFIWSQYHEITAGRSQNWITATQSVFVIYLGISYSLVLGGFYAPIIFELMIIPLAPAIASATASTTSGTITTSITTATSTTIIIRGGVIDITAKITERAAAKVAVSELSAIATKTVQSTISKEVAAAAAILLMGCSKPTASANQNGEIIHNFSFVNLIMAVDPKNLEILQNRAIGHFVKYQGIEYVIVGTATAK